MPLPPRKGFLDHIFIDCGLQAKGILVSIKFCQRSKKKALEGGFSLKKEEQQEIRNLFVLTFIPEIGVGTQVFDIRAEVRKRAALQGEIQEIDG